MNDRPDPVNANTEGLLFDIREEEGTDRWDLIQTVVEFLVRDTQRFIESRNRDHMYGLMNLLRLLDDEELLGVLPKDNGIYLPNVCGDLRLEGFDKNGGV